MAMCKPLDKMWLTLFLQINQFFMICKVVNCVKMQGNWFLIIYNTENLTLQQINVTEAASYTTHKYEQFNPT